MRVNIAILCVGLLGLSTPLFSGRLVIGKPGEAVAPGEFVITIRPNAPGFRLGQIAARRLARLGRLPALRQIRVSLNRVDDIESLREMAADDDVDVIEPNWIRKSQLAPSSDPSLNLQWALNAIGATNAWSMVPGMYLTANQMARPRVRVAVIDTGADCSHPDFVNSGGTTSNSAQGGQINWSLSETAYPTQVPSAVCTFQDDHGHGTHTAGIVGAATNNGIGAAGAGFPLEILVMKALDSTGSGTDVDIALAIVTAVNRGAKVVSMSLGGVGYSQILQDAVTYAWERGTLVVAAAGNSNSTALFFPAGAFHAVGVAAFESSGNRAAYSNRGFGVDISAPGSAIYSLLPSYPNHYGTNYGNLSGTSMATPFVSAAAGLMWMADPEITPDEVAARLERSAAGAGTTPAGWSPEFGYGRLHMERALTGANWRPAAAGGVTGQVVDSSGVPLASITLQLNGDSATTDDTGLFRFTNVPPGTHTVSATGGGLPNLTLSCEVAAGADSSLTVRMGVPHGTLQGAIGGGSAGGIFVHALQNGLVVASTVSDASGGYRLTVPVGVYQLRASGFGFITSVSNAVTVTAGNTTASDLTVTALGTISGHVRDLSAVPVESAQVLFQRAGASFGAISGITGNYTTLGLPAGSYTGSAEAGGFPGSGAVPGIGVSNGSETLANFTLGGVRGITVSPSQITLSNNERQQFTATVTGVASEDVTWSISPAAGAINTTGRYTAPSSNPAIQTVTVTATSKVDPTLQGTATIRLGDPINLSVVSALYEGMSSSSSFAELKQGPAGPSGVLVAISSSDPALIVPSSVVIPAGETRQPVTVHAGPLTTETVVTVTATYLGFSKSRNLTVKPVTVSHLRLNGTTLIPGRNYSLTVILRATTLAPKVVALNSSAPASVSVPATVTVPQGESQVQIPISVSPGASSVTLTASLNGAAAEITVPVEAASLSAIQIPSKVLGGVEYTGTIRLSGPAGTGGVSVTLTSLTPSLIPSPATVVVPSGATEATFTFRPVPVAAPAQASIRAGSGAGEKIGTTTIDPPAIYRALLTSSLTGGLSYPLTIRLNGLAPAGGVTVALASTPAGITHPASVLIPAGQSEVNVTVTAGSVAASTPVNLTATFNGAVNRSTTVQPPLITLLAPGVTTVYGGFPLTGNVIQLTGPAPSGGLPVQVTSTVPDVIPSTQVTVPAGQSSVTFDLATAVVTSNRGVSLQGITGTTKKTASITVKDVHVATLQITPDTVAGGSPVTARIVLEHAAPPGGLTVALTSSRTQVTVPATVNVPAGATFVDVPLTTGSTTAPVSVTIYANLNGTSRYGRVTVTP